MTISSGDTSRCTMEILWSAGYFRPWFFLSDEEPNLQNMPILASQIGYTIVDLGGGLEHFLFSHILGFYSSQLTFIFFRGVAQPPTSDLMVITWWCYATKNEIYDGFFFRNDHHLVNRMCSGTSPATLIQWWPFWMFWVSKASWFRKHLIIWVNICYNLWLVVWLPSILFSHYYWEYHHPNWLSYLVKSDC